VQRALRISALTLPSRASSVRTSVTDMPTRDTPDEAASEARARRLGLWRSEDVRRGLAREAASSHSPSAPGTWHGLPSPSATWPTQGLAVRSWLIDVDRILADGFPGKCPRWRKTSPLS
jgi:hypothetical protein